MKYLSILALIVFLLSTSYVYAQGLGFSMSFHDIIVLSRGGGSGVAPPAGCNIKADHQLARNALLVSIVGS